jgi:hypothetical protein
MTAAFIRPTISADAPAIVRMAAAYREDTIVNGICPGCGAVPVWPSRAERRGARGKVLHVSVAHDPDCIALAPELAAWVWGRR